ncbi:MAG: 2-amino-4-hydroxy-6-hydroxymethyldihydropteridine diphosphokinase [Desulfobacterales bacterium]|jgi:2-amino-4-hydroxy-6-hydroxymethyldihydropteridine diphosphokinase
MTSPVAHTAYISVGSNLGDKTTNCRLGIDAADRLEGCRVTGTSRFYRTAPVDYTDQAWFVNAAIRMSTRLSPQTLLERLQAIQTDAGRPREGIRFGPRILDLDILFFGNRIVDSPALTIPHPRLHKRRFVLEPLCDINPDIVHPVLNVSIQTLLSRIDDPEQEIIVLND